MTSKQEKLAAARRKLKEFQGKNKEGDILKQKNKDAPISRISKEYFYSGDSLVHNNSLASEIEYSLSNMNIHSNSVAQHLTEKSREDNIERKLSNSSSNESNLSKQYIYCNPDEKPNEIQEWNNSDGANRLKEGFHDIDRKNNAEIKCFLNTASTYNNTVMSEKNHENTKNIFSPHYNAVKVNSSETKELFNNDLIKSNLNNIIEPLQMELQNHSQTINILIQQRNDAQIALAEAQQLLNEKSGETEELKQKTVLLTSSVNNLNQRLSDAEGVIMKLKLEKEENLTKQEEMKLCSDKLQVQLEAKEEELQEVKRKYEEKNTDYQKLLFSFHEAQSQLSFHQIQLQQYSSEGHSSLAIQVSELQNENLSLKQKVLDLEKKLEMESAEKEESSQKFHIYAQQCNSQLSSLNSQLKSLKLENDDLSQKNNILSKSMSELESAKDRERTSSPKSFEIEIADLHYQLSALSEKNSELMSNLKEKEEECHHLEIKLDKKDSELNKLLGEFKKLEAENKNLANEADIPKASERLLATMESDKIAAAKAVSQNQKLKEQVVELEKAFMKLSEEKLELTNNLAHEKHINSELQNLLKDTKSSYGFTEDDDEHHQKCHHGVVKTEPLLNDSNEIEELRNIVRQLQDDKMELTARLNLFESNRSIFCEDAEKENQKCKHEHEQENDSCEDTKLLLQKMEEKVRKTMNEIAVLDEEKEKLEHLVLQLQGETETIGEYITLYQKQRMLLRQRAQEKDIQLLQLSKDKEELKSKLVALDELVQHLIVEKENVSIQPGSKLLTVDFSSGVPQNTVGKIRALINDIGSTTLINNQSIAFEHCSCCSGRLMTI